MKKLDEELNELQEGLDFSYAVAQVLGKPLTPEQQRARERDMMSLILSQTPEHQKRVQEVLGTASQEDSENRQENQRKDGTE